jgi:hypothetical protein
MTQTMWGGEAASYTNPWTGQGVATGANIPTDRNVLGSMSLPHATEFVTAQTEPPRVVARDRAIPLALVVGLISLTGGGLAAVLPIDREWLPAIGFVFAAINAAAAYYLRAVGEGDKDQARAERV